MKKLISIMCIIFICTGFVDPKSDSRIVQVNVNTRGHLIGDLYGVFQSHGSGFYIRPNIIMTASHNLHPSNGVREVQSVMINNELVQILIDDPQQDIALLKINKSLENMQPFNFSESLEELKVIGYPANKGYTVTPIDKILQRNTVIGIMYNSIVQIPNLFTAVMNTEKGNSGGPILNKDNEVVGMYICRWTDEDVIFGCAVESKALQKFIADKLPMS